MYIQCAFVGLIPKCEHSSLLSSVFTLSIDIASHPRRLEYPATPLWEPHIFTNLQFLALRTANTRFIHEDHKRDLPQVWRVCDNLCGAVVGYRLSEENGIKSEKRLISCHSIPHLFHMTSNEKSFQSFAPTSHQSALRAAARRCTCLNEPSTCVDW